LAGVLLAVFSFSSIGPAGVYLLSTFFHHHHGHEHTVHAGNGNSLILSHTAMEGHAPAVAAQTHDHVLPDGQVAVTRTAVTFSFVPAEVVVAIAPAAPNDSLPRDYHVKHTPAAASGPPLFLQHQILLI
jgi:hypothetical protein